MSEQKQPVKKGIESLKASILFDTKIKENCFNPNGCDKTGRIKCTQSDCDWKAYGLFRTLGKGVTVLSKNPIAKIHIFMPVAWETGS